MKPTPRDEARRAIHALIAGLALGVVLSALSGWRRPDTAGVSR